MNAPVAMPRAVRWASVVLVLGGVLLVGCALRMETGYRGTALCGLLLVASGFGVRRGSRRWRGCATVTLVLIEVVLLGVGILFCATWKLPACAAAIVLGEGTQRALRRGDAAVFFAPRERA